MQKIQPNAAAFKYDDRVPDSGDRKVTLGDRAKTALARAKESRPFPPRPSLWRRIYNWLVSRKFQVAAQLTTGVLFASLFTFIR